MGQHCNLRGFLCNESKKLHNLHCVTDSLHPPTLVLVALNLLGVWVRR